NASWPGAPAPRPSRTAPAHWAAEGLFRHGLKAFASKGAFLLHMPADGRQLVAADALLEPRGVGLRTLRRRTSHRHEAGVGCHEGIFATRQVGVHAGPVVMLGFLDHRGAH